MVILWNNQRGVQIRAMIRMLLLFLCFGLQAESIASKPEWKDITKKELQKKLKQYSFAKIRSSLVSPLDYRQEQVVFYSPCPDSFPKLEGEFPCSLLEWEASQRPVERNPADEYREGGEISVYLASQKSRLINGISILLTSQERKEKKGKYDIHPEDILIFYDPQYRISHYRIGNRVFLFRWKEEEGGNTLKSILKLTLNSGLYPESGQEIDFTKL